MMSIVLWIGGASLLSSAISAGFAGKLRLSRNRYLLVYVPLTALFLGLFVRSMGIVLPAFMLTNWAWGIPGILIAGFIVIRNVLSQEPYPRRRGGEFLLDLLWPGIAYGLTDGLLLSVFPVAVVYLSLPGADTTFPGSLLPAALGLAGSLVVTFFYHFGYPEFRNRRVLWTMYGNGVITLSYLITGSPLAAVLPHAAMHIAVVWHARESAGQLPPHYTGEKQGVTDATAIQYR